MANSPKGKAVTTVESIAGHIYVIRGEQMMVDSDLATLYGVPTSALNQAVTRNAERFPEDFAFKLTPRGVGRFEITFCDTKNRARGP